MPSMKQLQYLKKIVETGSYHLAAEQLFIAQSALSRQIILLEEELGFKIFNREQRQIQLTVAGAYFYKKKLSASTQFAANHTAGTGTESG